MVDIEKRARFDFIRYANCWEDADVLLQALQINKEDRCLSIASAGDNTLSLLVNDPQEIIAVDINPTQIACLELRISGFKHLHYEELLELLGVKDSNRRSVLYDTIKHDLSDGSKAYFDNNHHLIDDGIIFCGKFENYFKLFRTKIIPLIHRKKTVKALLAKKSIAEQQNFYKKKWNNLRFRLIFHFFFGRQNLGKQGRDPSFFKYVEGNVAKRILKRTEYALTKIPNYTNPYLNFILTGNFPLHALPHYLREENFQKIKANIGCITPFKGSVEDALNKYGSHYFDAFNLSDIFEYISYEEFINLLKKIHHSASKGARIAYWDMLAGRFLPEKDFPIHLNKELSSELFKQDKAFFYNAFIAGKITQ